MSEQNRFDMAIRMCDEANSKDPVTEVVDGETQPKELVYARRMSGWLERMHPDAPEPLRLAARFQHIERWKIPREEYPMDRQGYLKWRNALKAYHADRAGMSQSVIPAPEEAYEVVRELKKERRRAVLQHSEGNRAVNGFRDGTQKLPFTNAYPVVGG